MPALVAALYQSIAAYITPWSVTAMCLMPSSCALAVYSSMRPMPSSSENSVCRCRCANSATRRSSRRYDGVHFGAGDEQSIDVRTWNVCAFQVVWRTGRAIASATTCRTCRLSRRAPFVSVVFVGANIQYHRGYVACGIAQRLDRIKNDQLAGVPALVVFG